MGSEPLRGRPGGARDLICAILSPARPQHPFRWRFSWSGWLRPARAPARAPRRRGPRSGSGSRQRAACAGLAGWPGPEGAGRQVRAARGGRGGATEIRGGVTRGPAPGAAGPAASGHCACAHLVARLKTSVHRTLRHAFQVLPSATPPHLYLPRLWVPRLRASGAGFLGPAVKPGRIRRGYVGDRRLFLSTYVMLHP